MKKLFIYIFIFSAVSIYSQISLDNSGLSNKLKEDTKAVKDTDKHPFSIYLNPGIFLPVYIENDKQVGYDLQIGMQFNFNKNTAICLDYDLAFTNQQYYSHSRWNSYMMLGFGVRWFFPQSNKLKFLVAPEIGILLIRKGGKNYEINSLLPICFSFEAGFQYSLSKNLSALLKFKNSFQIRPQIFGGNTEADDFILINAGIGYNF